MPARASASAMARPRRTAPPVTSAARLFAGRGTCDGMMETMSSRLRNYLKVRFIAGFFFTVPVVATAYILWIFWVNIDDIFGPMYARLFGRPVPGLGFLTAAAIILLMGTIAR